MAELKIDFIGVGAEKSATSWLYKCLLEHPQICGIKEKEAVFFDTTPILGRLKRGVSDYERYGIEHYKQKFKHCPADSIKGEFTTTYLHDKEAARKIYENFPNVKILINLRNPADKAFAMYIGAEESHPYKTFEEAIEKEPEFIRRSMYAEYVEEYLKYFPMENVLITFYEDSARDPLLFIQKIYKFLGADSNFVPPSLNKPLDSEKTKIVTSLRNRLLKNTLAKKLIEFLRIFKLNVLINKILIHLTPKPEMDPNTRERLKKTFAPDIKKLEKIVGKDLSFWR